MSRPDVLTAVATQPYTTQLRRFPLPVIGPDDGLLRVEATAVCGTDWLIYGRESRGAGLGPLILGHEIVGRVEVIGEGAAERWGVAAGDRVAVEEFLPCGACGRCRVGTPWLCPATDSRGDGEFLRYGSTPVAVSPALYGGFGEYLYLHPRAMVHPVGDDVPPELAALYVPVSNGIRWVVREGRLPLGGTLVVIGPGQHGLGCVVAGRAAGAGRIVVVGTRADAHRLDVARELGADEVLFADEDAPAGVADVVVDLAPGAIGTPAAAIAMCAPRGTLVLAAAKHGKDVAVPHDLLVRKELRLVGVRGHDHASVTAAIELIRGGRYPLELLTTHRFPLERTADALDLAGRRTDPTAIHVTVTP
jgi:threonine dehydrogenase-like Zn-dependent dehydrogenase